MPFHGRGRNGKRHLQRRFLRKRGAAGIPLPSSPAAMPPSPRGRLNSLSQNLTVLPAPSGREPLAWRCSYQLNRKAACPGVPLPSAPAGRSHLPQGDGFSTPVSFPLHPEALPYCQRPHLRGGWHRAAMTGGVMLSQMLFSSADSSGIPPGSGGASAKD